MASEKEPHPSFKPPDDPNVRIWRYMPFIYFVSMLENKGLFFPRANLLRDPFEGSTTQMTKEAEKIGLRKLFQNEKKITEEAKEKKVEEFFKHSGLIRKEMVRGFFVSCWHMNEKESAAMWNVYGKFDVSIGIKSTYKRLQKVLPDYVKIGVVEYIDYEKDKIDAGNVFNFIMNKRHSFEYEKELRAVDWEALSGGGRDEIRKNATDFGLWFSLDLNKLIEGIYVNPESPEWVLSLVKSVLNLYGFQDINVLKSRLGADPIW